MKTIIYYIFLSLILFSCNSPKLKYCENEYKLIHNDTLKAITLDFEQNEADFEQQLLKELEVDSICGGSKIVGLPLDLKTDGFHKSFGAVNIPVVFYNDCRGNEIIFCGIRYDIFSSINAHNQILVYGNYIETKKDSIIKGLQKAWELREINFLKFNQTRFLIKASNRANTQTIKIVIDAYTRFYLKKLDEYCRKAYDMELCNMDKTIIQELKENYPFKIHICYTLDCSFSPPPPPPPPLPEETLFTN